ncbi:hypothetical protein Daus18300_000508 [Diaporthe australafricana]|uniref:Uncharacterized protein n=1 Tax=Diaporthe australafricana TaxID=127596 RepID=A0ABR3Y4J7_9PEZI
MFGFDHLYQRYFAPVFAQANDFSPPATVSNDELSATKDTLEAVRKVVVKHGQQHDAHDVKFNHLNKEVNIVTSRWHDQVMEDAKQTITDKMKVEMKSLDDKLDEKWEAIEAQGMARMRARIDHRAMVVANAKELNNEELKNKVDSFDKAVKKAGDTIKKVEEQIPKKANRSEVEKLQASVASFGRRMGTFEAAKKERDAARAKEMLDLVTKQDGFSGKVGTVERNQNALQSAHNDHEQVVKKLENRIKALENPLPVRQVTASNLGYISTAVGEAGQSQGDSVGHSRKEVGALTAKTDAHETRIQELESSTAGLNFEEIKGAFQSAEEKFVEQDRITGLIAEKFVEYDSSFHTISGKFDEIEAAKQAEVKAVKESSEETLRKAKDSAAVELRQQKKAADKEFREYKESAAQEMRLLKAAAQKELADHKASADKEFSEYRAKAEADSKAQIARTDDLTNQVARLATLVNQLIAAQNAGQIAAPQGPQQPPPGPPFTPDSTGNPNPSGSPQAPMGGTGGNGGGDVNGPGGGHDGGTSVGHDNGHVDTDMEDAPDAGSQQQAAEPPQQPTQQQPTQPQDTEMTWGPGPVSSNEPQATTQGPQQQPQAAGAGQPLPGTGPAQPSTPASTLPSSFAGLQNSMFAPAFTGTGPSQQPAQVPATPTAHVPSAPAAPVPSTPAAQFTAEPTPQLAPQQVHPELGPLVKSIFNPGADGFIMLPVAPSTPAPSVTPGQGPTAPTVYVVPKVEVPTVDWNLALTEKVDFAPEAELPGNDSNPPPSKAKPSTAAEFDFNSPREAVQKPDPSSPSPAPRRLPTSQKEFPSLPFGSIKKPELKTSSPLKQEVDGATPGTTELKAENEKPAPANATATGNTPASNGNAETAACKNDGTSANKQGDAPSKTAPGSSDINKDGSSSATGSSSSPPATPSAPNPTDGDTPKRTPKPAKKKKQVNVFMPKPKGTPGASSPAAPGSSPATPRKAPATPSKSTATPGKSPATQNARELAASVDAQRDAFETQFSTPQPEKKEFFIPGLMEGSNTPTGKTPGGTTPSPAKTSGEMEYSSKFHMFGAPPGESAAESAGPEHSSAPGKTQGSSGAAQTHVPEPPKSAGDSDIQMDGATDAPESTPAGTQPDNEDPNRFLERPKDADQRRMAKPKGRAAKLTPAQIEKVKRKTQEEGAALQPPKQEVPKTFTSRVMAEPKGRIDGMPASELAEHKNKTLTEAAWDQVNTSGWPSREPAENSSEPEDEVDYGDPNDPNDEDNHITVMAPPQLAQKPTRYSISWLKNWRDDNFNTYHLKRVAQYELGLESKEDVEEMAGLLRGYDDSKSNATWLENAGLPATQEVFTHQEIGRCFTVFREDVLFRALRAYLGDEADEKNWDHSVMKFRIELDGYFLYHQPDAI